MEQSLSLIEPYSNNLLSNAKYTKKHKPKSQTKKHKKHKPNYKLKVKKGFTVKKLLSKNQYGGGLFSFISNLFSFGGKARFMEFKNKLSKNKHSLEKEEKKVEAVANIFKNQFISVLIISNYI